MKTIPYACQDISEEDISSVVEALRSECLTQGPIHQAFEAAVADRCNAKFAVSTNSATSALHIACLALGVSRGDLVWTSAITFAATANAVMFTGAEVDFIDIDPRTFNISIECLQEKLKRANKIGKLPKVVIPVHIAGQSCEMDSIWSLSREYGFKIIEDASHAIGGAYLDNLIGSCRYSDITVFSFHPVKIITSGEGGMALTNDADLANKLKLYRSHGITSNHEEMLWRPELEIWNYQQIELGYNYRMTDIHAALGLSQLKRLNEFIAKRHALANNYQNILQNLPIKLPWQHPNAFSSFHLYIIRLGAKETGKTQKQVYKEMRDRGILVNFHYIPVYRHPYYEKLGFKSGYCQEAESYFKEALSIPMFTRLSGDEQIKVGTILESILT